MHRHQVLTGAANYGDHCFATGTVEGIHFTAYASGCDIIILASDFQRVQIIPGAIHGNVHVACLDCCSDSGKITASYGNRVCIFEPTPLLHHDSTHKLDYHWYQTGTIETDCSVLALSWNGDGSRLLTGGAVLQMWECPSVSEPTDTIGVEFYIEDQGSEEPLAWRCMWQCRPATTVNRVKFSPDGLLFATVGKADCLVKIWYENKRVQYPLLRMDSISPKKEELNYSFVYIAHPRAVTGFSWRKTSKYMPRGAVSNMLITSCKDHICRLWVETILPEDGLVDLQQLDPNSSPSASYHTQRHKNRLMQRLHHMRNIMNRRRRQTYGQSGQQGLPPLPSAQSEHDFHKFGVHPNSVAPGFHFHLAASINPDTDIPLLPAISTSRHGSEVGFMVHWLDNKELHFTLEAERILNELSRAHAPSSDDGADHEDGDTVHGSSTEEPMTNGLSDNATETTSSDGAESHKGLKKNRRKMLHKSGSQMSTESDVSACHTIPSRNSMNSMASESTVVGDESAKLSDGEEDFEVVSSLEAVQFITPSDHNKPCKPSLCKNPFQCCKRPKPEPLVAADQNLSVNDAGLTNPAYNHIDLHKDLEAEKNAKNTSEKLVCTRHVSFHLSIVQTLFDPDSQECQFNKFDIDHPHLERISSCSGSLSSTIELVPNPGISQAQADELDRQIEELLRDWHQSVDMLYCIHPIDGSFLVWLVDWMDEYTPGSFRQAQVSFSSRIPHALPIGDAMTMSPHIRLYCNHSQLDDKATLRESESKLFETEKPAPSASANAMGANSPGRTSNTLAPNVLMLTKHSNGSLNLWQITFAESSRFSTILSVAHTSRVSGHRFRANGAACHPVLPLLLTTSHHNVPQMDSNMQREEQTSKCPAMGTTIEPGPHGFCSELILWRVDPVGPLSKSGGISELARINSGHHAAFSNVAWLPTLLPSSTLGSFSNSPSALFVASDGTSLRVYQTVIDARTLCTDLGSRKKSEVLDMSRSNSSSSSGYVVTTPNVSSCPREVFNIVSLQSTARPGCIIELQSIADAKQDWQHLQLMHVFQERLVTGLNKDNSSMEAYVDLQDLADFEEHFFLIVIEKLPGGISVLHMWRIVIASQTHGDGGIQYTSDTQFYQEPEEDGEDTSSCHTPEPPKAPEMASPKLLISSNKVCTQVLELPKGVQIVHATVAAGHLSSSSIYPACFAPYLVTTACTDGQVRFWTCVVTEIPSEEAITPSISKFEWKEWEMMIRTDNLSTISIPGKPMTVSAAYSGRVAVAYRLGGIKVHNNNPDSKFVNLCVSIYECESSGGSEWTLEDTIELKNISLPETKDDIDLSYIFGGEHERDVDGHSTTLMSPSGSMPAIVKTVPIPSVATIQSIKRTLSTRLTGNQMGVLKQKHLVQLDWVPTEDGAHILTVAVGARVLLYAAVSSELSQASMKESKKAGGSRGRLQKSKSMTVQNFVQEIRWMKVRSIDLCTADSLPPLPMHISWVRDGILVVGMDNEMHVYTQWRGEGEGMESVKDLADARTLTEHNLRSVSSCASLSMPRLKTSLSSASIKMTPSFSSLSLLAERKEGSRRLDPSNSDLQKSESMTSLHVIQDCGLFEAARLANPVLPQYHPKQLIELLSFGKIHRVKAILAHLVRCISGYDVGILAAFGASDDISQTRQRLFSSPRPLSVASTAGGLDGGTIPEDMHSDTVEISSIPPLPLYALLAADKELIRTDASASAPMNPKQAPAAAEPDYSALFSPEMEEDDLEEELNHDDDDVFATRLDRRRSSTAAPKGNLNYFGPSQSSMLARHLTRTQLPGLSSLDQMYLLALADTVANTKDFNENQTAADVAVHKVVNREAGNPEISTEGLDDCGLRFMLAARHHIYLMNTLPMFQRAQLLKRGLNSSVLVWAFHSEADEELLSIIPSYNKGEPTWSELRQFGGGWWIRNINLLRRTIEKVAKTAFQANKDPLDSALFYLAMKKKNLLWGLFRSVDDTKMGTFFKHNFAEDRWRRAALKNAFALMGRQRFQHAAAFFLLAGALKDAIEVILTKLEDPQLAMVVVRLYDTELEDSMPANFRRILNEEVLGCDAEGKDQDVTAMSTDPFNRSMAHWMLKNYSAALGTLLEASPGSMSDDDKDEEADIYMTNPSVFNFYNYLRTHPLLVRQQLAATAQDRQQTVLLSGFSRGGAQGSFEEKNVTIIDRITPIERRLYFNTAHAHFKNGCPMLALEVLDKLPEVIDLENDITKSRSADSVCSKSPISTGTLGGGDDPSKAETADAFDWSAPATKDKTNAFDWSTPVSGQTADSLDWGGNSSDFDWSKPLSGLKDEPLDLTLDSDHEDNDTKSDSEIERKDKLSKTQSDDQAAAEGLDEQDNRGSGDIMAQQLKFIACLKIMMEELSTLATGFEVDGGQLRFQLYIWLEREVDVLKKVCAYGLDMQSTVPMDPTTGKPSGEGSMEENSLSAGALDNMGTLHEVLLAEKLDFEAKQQRMARRKQWLLAHQQLVRTLLSYSVLHGSCGGGLASVRMELILLLQELQQEKTQQQLLSPLPFPTTLPLLSASVASAKTVIADPIRHLQSLSQDLLHSLTEFTAPPKLNGNLNTVFLLRNLAAALSACIYQCLCDSDSFVVAAADQVDVGMEGFTSTGVVYKDSYLMAGTQRRRKMSSASDDQPNSQPAKWPGVSSLRALLAKEKDEDAPKVNILLSESLIAVYMCLLVHALSMYDANILFRLIAHPFKERMWPALFGGGVKKLIRVASSADVQRRPTNRSQEELQKQRMRLHMRVLGHDGNSPRLKEDKPTYKEKFVPPEISMISYLMAKPFVNPDSPSVDYDSADSAMSSDDEEEEEYAVRRNDTALQEHLDPNSYSWCLMRYAMVHYVRHSLLQFLPLIGIELPELPVCSPLLQSILHTLDKWDMLLQQRLDLFAGPPSDYIPGCFVDTATDGPTIDKYRAMLEVINTPFLSSHCSALPAKRLWHSLVKLDFLKEVFIRYIFKKRRPQHSQDPSSCSESPVSSMAVDDPMKIIHKDQDGVTAFCVNQANLNCVAIATPKEVVEMDVTGILTPPMWLEDETEYDIEKIRNPTTKLEAEEFLVVQTPMDRASLGFINYNQAPPTAHPGIVPAPHGHMMSQTGRGGGVMKGLGIPGITNPYFSMYILDRSRRLMRRLVRRPLSGVRRMGAHPHLPYYLTGSQDGSVRLMEWGHQQVIGVPRQPGSYPKVTKVTFNSHGNKFGVSDAEGSLGLWQIGLGVGMNRPFMNLKCHSKSLSDFVFVGSSSLLATAGHSSDNRNVCLWDTLLPYRKAQIAGFQCHADGSSALLYSAKHQFLIGGGKKGDINIFDTRQRQLRHTFQAHDSAIKSMALDPAEEFFATGSADGDIKVWGLSVHALMFSFPGEHAKNSIFRNMGSGVIQLHLNGKKQLFSCGADGSMKVRQLPQQGGSVVQNWYS